MALAAAGAGAAPPIFGFGSLGKATPAVAAPGSARIVAESKASDGSSLRDFGLALPGPSREAIRELAPFSSLVDLAWDHPDLAELIPYAKSYGMKTLVAVHELFFITEVSSRDEQPISRLRTDYRERWDAFVERNQEVLGYGTVWAFYLADEPFWNRIPAADLTAANRAVRGTFPMIPTMASLGRYDVEAAPADLSPGLLGLVGYHDYALAADPTVDPEYQYYLALLREKFPGRDYVIVADAWWSDGQHGAAGLEFATLAARASGYLQVAEDVGAVALAAFVWQSFDGGTGLRELPEEVTREYIRIGSEVTGRCGVPAAVGALAGTTSLFLQDCRFSVRARWRHPATGEEGDGVALPLTPDTGLFWFFDPSNVELTVKVLDGTEVNGSWWIYWSHMTNLEVRLEVTDTATGQTRTYSEPATDTAAFPGP